MDSRTGQLNPSAGTHDKEDVFDVEIIGTKEPAERISLAVKTLYTKEQKTAKKARRKTTKASRRANR